MNPPLSIVIAVWTGSAPVLNCLKSLEALPERRQIQVVLANTCGSKVASIIKEQFPDVCVVDVSSGESIAKSRHAAIEHCTAPMIGILHERYSVPADWASAVMAELAQGSEVVCGAVRPSEIMSASQWAMYLSEYSHVAPPLPPALLGTGDEVSVPGGNVVYLKLLLDKFTMANSLWELDYHASLLAKGAQFRRSSSMDVYFASPFSIREYVSERLRISHDFAAQRSAKLSRGRATITAFFHLALPLLLTTRIVSRILRKRQFMAPLLKALPWIMCFGLVQTAGEISGYLSRKRT